MLSSKKLELVQERRKLPLAVLLVFLMLASTMLAIVEGISQQESPAPETALVTGGSLGMSLAQDISQTGQGTWEGGNDGGMTLGHEALSNIMWTDPGVGAGIIMDLSVLEFALPAYASLLEETQTGDHDNDGIDDLNDLDDDNDGIFDLLERFDGCYGTDPYDHDNDGILDVDDWDDDNDGILEGPIDYDALEAQGLDPRNVSTDRYLDASIEHPYANIGQIGSFYLADQNPMDHDNDGVTDEDSDGSGAGRYDEDDDNDGRIDQFTWPCDMDWDGIPDYFDTDDDGDGTPDENDVHPYDATQSGTMAVAAAASSTDELVYAAATTWTFNQYRDYSGGVDYVDWERNRVNGAGATASGFRAFGAQGTPSFTTIVDGDLDGDGSPNFLDPDNDNDGTPDSADTDDDNDGILDMVDPDSDNDGIPDACIEIDTNGDQISDYTGLRSGGVTSVILTAGGTNYANASNVPTSTSGAGSGMTVDIITNNTIVTSVSVNEEGFGYSVGDSVSITTGNSGATIITTATLMTTCVGRLTKTTTASTTGSTRTWAVQQNPITSETLPLAEQISRTTSTTTTLRTKTTRSLLMLPMMWRHGTAQLKPTPTQPARTFGVKHVALPFLNSTTGTAMASTIGMTLMTTTTASSTFWTSIGIVTSTTTTTSTSSTGRSIVTTDPTTSTPTWTAMGWKTALTGTTTTTAYPTSTTQTTEIAVLWTSTTPTPSAHPTTP